MRKYHDDPDSAFWGWNDIWLHPEFRNWTIEQDIRTITCPLLAVQGVDDEYGTLAQIRGIAAVLPQAGASCGRRADDGRIGQCRRHSIDHA